MAKHMIIQVSHKSIKYLKQTNNKFQPPNNKKEQRATLSLEAYDLYIFLPFGNKLPKSSKMHSAKRLSSLASWGGVEMTPRM